MHPNQSGKEPLLDRRFDEMSESEQINLMKALFSRAEALTPMMMR